MLRGLIAFLVFIAVGTCRATAPITGTSPAGDAPALSATGQIRGGEQTSAAEAPVDQLIPWLLDEDRQLRGIPSKGAGVRSAKRNRSTRSQANQRRARRSYATHERD